jgi:predicted phosphodiesterase
LGGLAATPTRSPIVRFGLIADVHKDIIHDADRRLAAFVEEAKRRDLDFIIQLGDFCVPIDRNRGFLEIWNSFPGPRYHVLGNHDIDGGHTWDQTMRFYGMDRPYGSFDVEGCHFIFLDGNEKAPRPQAGYARHIGRQQLAWLERDLGATEKPTVVFSHQSLENPGGVENGAEVRGVVERAGGPKVVACLSGHHHIDYLGEIGAIPYVQVNSASYYWVGSKFKHARFSPEIERDHPNLSSTIPYRDPLFAFATIDPSSGRMAIEGRTSAYLEPGPEALGMPAEPENNRPSPRISDRVVRFGPT